MRTRKVTSPRGARASCASAGVALKGSLVASLLGMTARACARAESLLREERALRAHQLRELLLADLGILEAERVERFDDGRSHGDAGEPLVVGGHDVPRRPLRGGVADHVLVGLHVVLPVVAFLRVGRRELPVLLGIVDALEETPLLLLARDVQEELEDDGAVVVEVALVGPDVPEPILPDALADAS